MEVVHVLTLAHREDRLLAVAREAKQQGFAIFFHEGQYAEERKDAMRFICMGHKKIIRYAIEHKMPSIIIAEDDVEFFGEGAFQYWIDNTPDDYDLYCATIFHGDVNTETNRIVNGMSATMSCYRVSERFYPVILNDIADNSHIDRSLGDLAHKYKYFVPPLLCCTQRQGFSDNLRRPTSDYNVYLEDKKIYGRDTL